MMTSGARPAPSTGEEATIVLSGVGSDVSDAMLMNMYRTYGPITRVKHNGTNSAYDSVAIFVNAACVLLLLAEMNDFLY